jgi:HNH endonuclease
LNNTYQPKTNYRKIYEQHYGPIPVDSAGRTYDIHHIDGDRSNNSPKNLIAVSIADHYNIHYAQGEHGACLRIGQRMQLSPDKIALIAQKIGRANKGKKRTEESKSKMRNRKLGIKQNEKQKAHKYNRVVSDETREKSRNSNLGKTRSKQTCQNVSAAVKNQIATGTHSSQIKYSCINCKTIYSITNLSKHSCV